MTGKPLIVGLTGSIGMGKSTVAAMFAEAGVPVFDADAAVHRLQGPGGRLVGAIESLHPGTTGPDGVDRAKLSAAVLGNPDALRALEQLVHPAVGEDRAAFLRQHADSPLIEAAQANGLHFVDGLHMLVEQAAASFKLFFGSDPPRDRDRELWQKISR